MASSHEGSPRPVRRVGATCVIRQIIQAQQSQHLLPQKHWCHEHEDSRAISPSSPAAGCRILLVFPGPGGGSEAFIFGTALCTPEPERNGYGIVGHPAFLARALLQRRQPGRSLPDRSVAQWQIQLESSAHCVRGINDLIHAWRPGRRHNPALPGSGGQCRRSEPLVQHRQRHHKRGRNRSGRAAQPDRNRTGRNRNRSVVAGAHRRRSSNRLPH